MTKTFDVEATNISVADLLASLRAGQEVVIQEHGTPVAQLVSLGTKKVKRIGGIEPGIVQMSDDFDKPLPDSFWLGET